MLIRFLLGLMCLLSPAVDAGVIPPPDKMDGVPRKRVQEMTDLCKTDCRKALVFSRQLFAERALLSANNQAWTRFQYAYLLLENDSISKALSLLVDTIGSKPSVLRPSMQAFRNLDLAVVNTYLGHYALADSLFGLALNLTDDIILRSKIHQALADNFRYQGKLDISYANWLKALQLSERLKDSTEIYNCYMGIGVVEFLRESLDEAEENFSIYYTYYTSVLNRKKAANALSMLGLVAYQRDQYELSIQRALRSYNTRVEIQDIKGQGESLNNLALGYMGLKNWSQALRYLEDAVLIKAQANDLTQMTVIYNNIGHCHRQLGDVDKAIEYFERALNKGTTNGQYRDVLQSYRNLIFIYNREKQDFEQAFKLQSRMMGIKDSLAVVERREAMQELEVRYETQKKQREIELLQQERTLITNRWLTLALGLFFAFVIGILFYDNQRRKHTQEKQLLSAEDELQKAELKIMSGLLEHNRQKLSLYTENLLRKNELVNRLEDKLKDVVEEDHGEEGKAILKNVSSVRILTDEDWEEFKQLFDGVHRGMLERLLIKHENLTLAEQCLFLLMKLSMSTKQIANILGVSPDSVKKGRYRLKKKLELDDDVLLQNFIDNF